MLKINVSEKLLKKEKYLTKEESLEIYMSAIKLRKAHQIKENIEYNRKIKYPDIKYIN